MAGKRILVVDDDTKTVELVKLYLNRDGYKVLVAYEGNEALRLARELRPDLIVLDLMLPGLDGLEICKKLRAESDVPIIMLTAKISEEDRLSGLNIGADDYVTKPFSPRELAARVRTVLRRLPEDALERGPVEITQGELRINFVKREVYLANKQVNLTPVEYRLLGVIIREPGRTFSRAQLVDRVYGLDFEGFDRTLDVHIRNLRKKLELDPDHPKYIKTIYGAGYAFAGGQQ